MGATVGHGGPLYGPSYTDVNLVSDKFLVIGVICLILLAIFFTAMFGSHYSEITEYEIEVPITWEIPEAIRVTEIEEKFSQMEFRSAFLGGAGAGVGGLGAVPIRVDSAEKLLLIIDLDEPIYASLGYPINVQGLEDRGRVVQRFAAFLKDRPGIVIYEKVYSPNQEGYVFEASFDEGSATFHVRERKTEWVWFGHLRGVDNPEVFENK